MAEQRRIDDSQADDLHTLYQAADRAEPPPALDAEIKEAAREALRAKPGITPRRQGAAVAAVMVLAVAVYLVVPSEERLPAAVKNGGSADTPRQAIRARELPARPDRAMEAAPLPAPMVASPPSSDELVAPAPQAMSPQTGGEAARPPASPAGGEQDIEASYYRSSPALWAAHIQRLLSNGQFEQARSEFEGFRATHPEHPYAAVQQ